MTDAAAPSRASSTAASNQYSAFRDKNEIPSDSDDDDGSAQGEEDSEVEDERRREQRVLACVVHDDGVGATHENFARVLVHGALAVGDLRHVLDDDDVVGVLVRLVEQAVGHDHIVDDVGFGDLFRPEGLRRGEVLAVVVAEVVV